MTWVMMRNRCNSPLARNYHNYGGRGIRVCDRWNSFSVFLEDVGARPPGTSLDRIDNNGNYEPGNVRWASRRTQILNSRQAKLDVVTAGQVRWLTREGGHTLSAVANAFGIDRNYVCAIGTGKYWRDA